jgi:hypothetical protein
MESCTIETGLLRKKPCGHPAVTHCKTCEQPLCAQHAVAQLSAAHKKTGVFMCKECDAARAEYDKGQARVAKHAEEKRLAEMMNSIAHPAPPKPKTPAPGAAPGAQAQGAPAAPAKADSGALEFTPGEKKPEGGGLEFTPSDEKADSAPLEFTPGDKKK